MILFRLVLLLVVAYLGAVVFYSRRDLEPRRLVVFSANRAAVLSLWTIGAFLLITLVEWAFINS